MCTVVGIYSERPMPMLPHLYFMMLATQHRGQEASGLILSDRENCIGKNHFRRMAGGVASVNHLFYKQSLPPMDEEFFIGMGHNRYATSGAVARIENAQPLFAKTKYGEVAVGHNGNLPYAAEDRRELEQDGAIFMSDSDTEVILAKISRSKRGTLEEAIKESVESVRGSYSLIFMTRDKLIAVRDPYGFRPLCLGEHDNGIAIASESCAFSESQGFRFVREIERGEMLVMDEHGLTSTKLSAIPRHGAHCIFELVYFARPDSFMFGHGVAEFRMKTGCLHAQRYPLAVDGVVAIPDSANYFAFGQAETLGVPLIPALIRNHYTGRTFINPHRKDITIKLSPIRSLICGKRLSVADDSIVRSNTSRDVIQLMKTCSWRDLARAIQTCGPSELHFSVGFPPIYAYCPYGIDIKNKEELATNGRNVEGIRELIKVNSLNYLWMDDLQTAAGNADDFCYGCLGGEYVA